MHVIEQKIDATLASALRVGVVPAEQEWQNHADVDCAQHRAHYHGVSGLLVGLPGWPAKFASAIRTEALGRAMWEMRHRQLLAQVLGALADNELRALLIKGTAFAYDLYDEPAHRIRGDSDLWVCDADLGCVRQVLQELGFRIAGTSEQVSTQPLQEVWLGQTPDGSEHVIDLHWSAVNSAALQGLFSFDECWARRQPLPRLARGAWCLDHPDALLHSAVHREMHAVSPYIVGNTTHYGGDRLVWIWDIHQLTLALGNGGLREAADRASVAGLRAPLRNALLAAKGLLGTPVQDNLLDELGQAKITAASRYLEGGQVKRAWLDLKEVRPFSRKLATISHRIFPSAAFLGLKYGRSRSGEVPMLYLRRLIDFVRRRPKQSQS